MITSEQEHKVHQKPASSSISIWERVYVPQEEMPQYKIKGGDKAKRWRLAPLNEKTHNRSRRLNLYLYLMSLVGCRSRNIQSAQSHISTKLTVSTILIDLRTFNAT